MRVDGLGYYIIKISKNLKKAKEDDCKDLNLTSQQFHIMLYLARHEKEKINQKRLENEFELSNATISGILKRLECKGYIIRSVSNLDKRDKFISLSKEGYKIRDAMNERFKISEEKLLAPLNNSERELLMDYLERIKKNMEGEC